MNCQNFVIMGWNAKSNKPAKIMGWGKDQQQIDWVQESIVKFNKKAILSHVEPCGGKATSRVRIEYDPYFGGMDSHVGVEFVCNRCGCRFDELPSNVEALNKFLDEILEAK